MANINKKEAEVTAVEKETSLNIHEKKVPFAVAEAYKNIRANIMFLFASSESKIMTITSPVSSEGKSTTAINTAVAFSQLGEKTLVLDADMRKPTVHKKLGVKNDVGLSNLLAGFVETDECITHIYENLDVITAGRTPPNPAELLGSERFKEILDELSKKYKYILIDTPPVNIVLDALVVSKHTSGILLVVRDKFTQNEAIRYALSTIEFAGANVLGAIMNGANPESKTKYNKRYGYGRYSRYSYRKYSRYGYGFVGKYGEDKK